MIHSTFPCTVMTILCHWTWLIHVSSADPTCYFPNGDIASTYKPCNSTVDVGASVCCELSTSACGSKGLCFGSNGYLYRGGCTDRLWKSGRCPTHCQHGMKLSINCTKTKRSGFYRTDFSVEAARHTYAPLVPCTDGAITGDFCCFSSGRGDSSTRRDSSWRRDSSGGRNSCCNQKFSLWNPGDLNGAGIPFVPSAGTQSTGLSASSSSSTSTSAPLASAVTPDSASSAMISVASTPQSPSSNLTAVGVGVGVPLGLLLALNLGFLFYRERRHRLNTQQLIQQSIAAADEARESKSQYLGLSRESALRSKLIGELDSHQVHEIHHDTS